MRRRLAALLSTAADRFGGAEATSGSEQWQRVVLNQEVERHLRALGPSALDAGEISGDGRGGLGWQSFASLDFPEFDLCAPLDATQRERFDVVVCEQVLEHVLDPAAAVRNLRALCRPGGHVVVSTPFLIRVHELADWGLIDLWRFTPRGLGVLLESAGLQVDHVGTWGNRECVAGNLDRWPAYRRWHTLRNEPDLPVQVWAFAQVPQTDN